MRTCDRTLAGVARGRRSNPIRRGGDLIAAVFDHDGVATHPVRHVRHFIGSVPVVLNLGFLGFPILVLENMEEREDEL